MKYFQKFSQIFFYLFFAALLIGIFFFRLGSQHSMADWDESIYTQIAHQILITKDWITLHWGSQLWFEKPPMYMWLTAINFKLFGVTEFWGRAVSALSGLLMVGLVYLFGSKLKNKKAGYFGALVLALSYHFVATSRLGMTDVLLTLFLYSTLYCTYLALNGFKYGWQIAGITLGCAILTKGAAAMILPVSVFAYLVLTRQLVLVLRKKAFWWGIFWVLAVSVPWHLANTILHGKYFWDNYLLYHVLKRASVPIEGHSGSYAFYIDLMTNLYKPWVYLLPFGLVFEIQRNKKDNQSSLLILVYLALTFLLFSIASTKLYAYIIPLYPGLAIILGIFLSKMGENNQEGAFARSSLWLACLMAVLTSSGLLVPKIGLIILGLAMVLIWLKPKSLLFLTYFVCLGLMCGLSLKILRPIYRNDPPTREKVLGAEIVKEVSASKLPIYYFPGVTGPSALYYTGIQALNLDSAAQVKAALLTSPQLILATDSKTADQLQGEVRMQRIFQSGDYLLIKVLPL